MVTDSLSKVLACSLSDNLSSLRAESFRFNFLQQDDQSLRSWVLLHHVFHCFLLRFQLLWDEALRCLGLVQLEQDEDTTSIDSLIEVLEQNFSHCLWELELLLILTLASLHGLAYLSLDHIFKHSVQERMPEEQLLNSRLLVVPFVGLLNLSEHLIHQVRGAGFTLLS